MFWVFFLLAALFLLGLEKRRAGPGRYALVLLVSTATLAVVYLQFPAG